MRSRTALSLIEVAIALVIFSTVLAITLESLAGIRQFVNSAAMEDTLANEADTILRDIADDLSNSAWLIQIPEADLVNLNSNPTWDRQSARYYPYVVVQDYETATASDTIVVNVDGMPNDTGWYEDFKRDASMVATPDYLLERKPNLPADHLLPSQELIFLKVARGPHKNEPELVEPDWIRFDDDPAPMTAYNDPGNIPVINSLGLAVRTDVSPVVTDVPLSWEVKADGLTPADIWDETADEYKLENLRTYTYALIPGGAYGTQLVRRYRNTEGEAVEDLDVLGSSVDRIVIDTYRTAGDLAVNQIRVRLWLSRPSDDNPLVPTTYFAETVLAMRSTVDPEYSLKYTDWLGQAGSFGLF